MLGYKLYILYVNDKWRIQVFTLLIVLWDEHMENNLEVLC